MPHAIANLLGFECLPSAGTPELELFKNSRHPGTVTIIIVDFVLIMQ